MVSNKRKAWDEAVEMGLIDDYVKYSDITEKDILLLIEDAEMDVPEEEEIEEIPYKDEIVQEPDPNEIMEVPAILCDVCGKDGTARAYGVCLCDTCYDDLNSIEEENSDVADDDVWESKAVEEDVSEPEVEDIPEEVPEPEDIPEVVFEPEVVEVPKVVPVKITRNTVAGAIELGTVVTFKCRPGSNIRKFSGDMAVGFVVGKRDRERTYTGPLTKRLKKEISLKRIILLR